MFDTISTCAQEKETVGNVQPARSNYYVVMAVMVYIYLGSPVVMECGMDGVYPGNHIRRYMIAILLLQDTSSAVAVASSLFRAPSSHQVIGTGGGGGGGGYQ